MAVKPIVTRRLYMGGATGYKTGGGRIICVSVSGIQSGGHVWAWPLMDRDRRFRRQPKLSAARRSARVGAGAQRGPGGGFGVGRSVGGEVAMPLNKVVTNF